MPHVATYRQVLHMCSGILSGDTTGQMCVLERLPGVSCMPRYPSTPSGCIFGVEYSSVLLDREEFMHDHEIQYDTMYYA